MEANYSFDAMVNFLQFAQDRGLMNASTAAGQRVAAAKIREFLSDSDLNDVRNLDVESAFRRFANKHGTSFSPSTLKEYKRRLGVAIDEFVDWTNNPADYKPRARAPRPSNEQPAKSVKSVKPQQSRPTQHHAESRLNPEGSASLQLPYPLRSDFLAQITIPRDLTIEEARRIGAFITTLAVDYRPND